MRKTPIIIDILKCDIQYSLKQQALCPVLKSDHRFAYLAVSIKLVRVWILSLGKNLRREEHACITSRTITFNAKRERYGSRAVIVTNSIRVLRSVLKKNTLEKYILYI